MFKKRIKILCLTVLIVMFGCAGQAPQVLKSDPIPIDVAVTVQIDDAECVINRAGVLKGPQLSQLSWVMHDVGYLKLFSGLSVADVTRLWNDMIVFQGRGIEEVTIFLNSPGGDAFSGLALAQHIIRFKEQGMIINIEASGIVASAAVPIMAVGSHRDALPGTIFMVHEAALWKWPGRETASDIRSQNELMELLRAEYLGILDEYTTTPLDEWERLEGRTTWFNVDTARSLGLID